jgi:hypothetical protein
MAKSSAERKAAQRRGNLPPATGKLSWFSMRRNWTCWRNCAARRPGRDPYELAEYIALLIRQDDARLSGHIKSISKRLCGKCGESLPITSCPCAGDSQCWVTRGWHETKLSA